jgi:hypothetical protein
MCCLAVASTESFHKLGRLPVMLVVKSIRSASPVSTGFRMRNVAIHNAVSVGTSQRLTYLCVGDPLNTGSV